MAKNIFLKGGCDIDAISFYLKGEYKKESSIKTTKHGIVYYSGHSTILSQALLCPTHINKDNIFADEEIYYSNINNEKIDFLVLSTITEAFLGLYRNKTNKQIIAYGESYTSAIQFPEKYIKGECLFGYSEFKMENYEILKREYEFLGRITPHDSLSNFVQIINELPKETKICFILPPYIHDETKEMSTALIEADIFNEKLSKLLTQHFCNNTKISFIDPNKYLAKHYRSKYFYYNFQSMTHYKRRVYFHLAKDLQKVTNNKIKATKRNEYKRLIRKLKTKIKVTCNISQRMKKY